MAPENLDRFVVIDGVQVSRARAQRRGLIPSETTTNGPAETRARTSASARTPESRHEAATALAAQAGTGAVSVGEDAARAGAASTPAAAAASVAPAGDSSSSTNDASTPAGTDTASTPAETSTPDAAAPAHADTTATPAETATPAVDSSVAKGDVKPRTRTR